MSAFTPYPPPTIPTESTEYSDDSHKQHHGNFRKINGSSNDYFHKTDYDNFPRPDDNNDTVKLL